MDDSGATRRGMDEQVAMDFCANLPSAQLTHPFGFESAVFKVRDKMFAVLSIGSPPSRITLKCRPEDAAVLAREHEPITPGYHMNKKHWITVDLDGDLPEGLVADLITESYQLVIAGLPAARRPLA